MLKRGQELIRISPKSPEKIEISTNSGYNWSTRYSGGIGKFSDIMDNGNEILGTTDSGLYVSTNDGYNWSRRS
jgi:hypothetical protein